MKLEQVLELLKKQDVTHTGMITGEQELQKKIEEMGEDEFKRRYITKIGVTIDGDVTYTYSVPEVVLEYQEAPAEGGTLIPTYSYSQSWEGSDGSSGVITEGADLLFTSETLEVDDSTGEVDVPVNESPDYITLGDVTLEVSINEQTGTATTTIYQAAAEVTPTSVSTYDELKEALESGVESIQLSADITAEDSLVVTSDCTIDLNGYTVTKEDATAACAAFIVSGGVVNFTGDGTVQSNGDSTSDWVQALWVNDESAVVNINGGSWKGGIWNNPDDMSTGSSACIYVEYGLVNIYDGSFECGYATDMKQYSVLNCKDASYKAGTANIVVYGGEYYNFDPANNDSEGTGTNFCADGYVSELDNNNWYHVVTVDEDTPNNTDTPEETPISTYSTNETTTKKSRKKKS